MSAPTVTQLPIPRLVLGEAPHWLEEEDQSSSLIFVDVFSKKLRRHFVNTDRHQVLNIDDGGATEKVSFVIPVEGSVDQFVVGLGNTVSVVQWSPSDPDNHTTTPTTLHTTTDSSFNDAKCDPQGRLWAGTMTALGKNGERLEPNKSHLYKFDQDLSCTTWVKQVTISNGLAWSEANQSFYYIDTPALCIYQFDYDDAVGAISNRRVLMDYKAAGLTNQAPDGMAIDVEGNLWVACFGGSQVICVDGKSGRIIRKVAIPSPTVTSVCWGGRDYSTLYVTTGTRRLSPEQIAALPSAGGTFAVTGLGTRGSPPVSYKLDLNKLKTFLK